ncbi:radical SAM protein [Candidatus Micrarchaeota archaeon]|nr:radical SAM protein [Candidatus Micrarchaeota archaeon]
MKILLMNPAFNGTMQSASLYPSTLLTLGSMLGPQPRMNLGPVKGVEVAIETILGVTPGHVAHTDESTTKALTETLQTHKPDIVGMGVSEGNINSIIWTCKKLRELDPTLKILVGGDFATLFPITTMKETGADVLLRGEADLSLRDLMAALVSGGTGKSLLGIPGLLIRDENSGEILSSYESSEIPILRPDYLEKIEYDMALLERSIGYATDVGIVGSRGCGFGGCPFCSVNIKQKLRRISDDRTIEILEQLHAFASDSEKKLTVNMSDPAFGGTKKGLIGLLNKMRGRFDASYLGVNLAVDQLLEQGEKGERKPSLDIIHMLATAGINYVELGVESFSDDLLKRIKCGRYTGEEASAVIIELANAGVKITVDTILTDIYSTVNELRDHVKLMLRTILGAREINPTCLYLSNPNPFVIPHPGTKYYAEVLAAHTEADWESGKITGKLSSDPDHPYYDLRVGVPDAISRAVKLDRISVVFDSVNFHDGPDQLIKAGLADHRLNWFCDQTMNVPDSVVLSFLLMKDRPINYIVKHYTEEKGAVELPLLG